jgi:hypothetical protein
MSRARPFGNIRQLPSGRCQARYWHLGKPGVYDTIGAEHFFPSVRSAVRSVTGDPEDDTERLMQRYFIED